MALFVFVTDRCSKDASTHGLEDEVERFRARVEKTLSTSLFDPFPPPYLVKKKLGSRQSRLIAERREVDGHAVIIFLAILIRGNRDYEKEFARDPQGYGHEHFRDLFDDQQLASFVADRTANDAPAPKPEPAEHEYGFLYEAFSHHESSGSDLVCETSEWVQRITAEPFSSRLILFCQPCLTAFEREPGLHFVPVEGRSGMGVWALRLPQRLVLLTPSTEATQTDDKALAQRLASPLENATSEAILRASRRVYPPLILADDDLWMDLEREPVANLALSPEESEVLDSARRSDHPFPLFINGRAGSGKSTILQYLFADLLFYYLTRSGTLESVAPPIYLTANPELLRVARDFVSRLLRTESTFRQQVQVDLEPNGRVVLDEAFREFYPHLLSLLPPESRDNFPVSRRIHYSTFRDLWMARFGKDKKMRRDAGPEISWHVIRSYIKGLSSETVLEPEDYDQLPHNQKTVTQETFRFVFDRVWTAWYDGIKATGYWDDQDLTRHILDNDLARPTYPAVVCDESQDFTRIELELLLRLNLFSDRSLPPEAISRVPFAFAGDQFQTLNPTGFRWDNIKASFVEKFIFELDPARRSGRTDLNYRELNFNYRSTRPIVHFSNHVQALRAALFQIPDLRPQQPWTLQQYAFPVTWFRSRDANFWKKFVSNGAMVLVVPCDAGEEADYVRNDPVLRSYIHIENEVPRNVLSAARTKGCEYSSVVAYGFGHEQPIDPLRMLEDAVALDTDTSLPLQYFINRLYVAVSRAKRRLVVVDTDEAFDSLWRSASNPTLEAELIESIKNGPQVWKSFVSGMQIGNHDDLVREDVGEPLENARAFEADGLARRDGFLLLQAAQAYRNAGEEAKARECRARALEADRELVDAAAAFFEAGFPEDGVRCLWNAGEDGWRLMRNHLAGAPNIRRAIEYRIATTLTSDKPAEDAVDLLEHFAGHLKAKEFGSRARGDAVWQKAVSMLFDRIIGEHKVIDSSDRARRALACCEDLRHFGLVLALDSRCELLLRAGRREEALELWEKAGDPKPQSYHLERASTLPVPERISYLARAKMTVDVLSEYDAAGPNVALEIEGTKAVIAAMIDKERFADAADLAWRFQLSPQMLEVARSARLKNQTEAAAAALRAAVPLIINDRHWDLAIALATDKDFAPTPDWKVRTLQNWVRSETVTLQTELVRGLARSDDFVSLTSKWQRPLTEFLSSFLRVKGGKWFDSLSAEEAGAALERGGRITDALVFYEALARERPAAQGFARRRWERTKRRQIQYELGQSARAKAVALEEELLRTLRSWNMPDFREPDEYPKVPQLTRPGDGDPEPVAPGSGGAPEIAASAADQAPPPSRPDHFHASVGDFHIEFSRSVQRCNLTNQKTMQTAFIKIGDATCGGETTVTAVADGAWRAPEWEIDIALTAGDPGLLILDFRNLGIQLSIVVG